MSLFHCHIKRLSFNNCNIATHLAQEIVLRMNLPDVTMQLSWFWFITTVEMDGFSSNWDEKKATEASDPTWSSVISSRGSTASFLAVVHAARGFSWSRSFTLEEELRWVRHRAYWVYQAGKIGPFRAK